MRSCLICYKQRMRNVRNLLQKCGDDKNNVFNCRDQKEVIYLELGDVKLRLNVIWNNQELERLHFPVNSCI